MRLARGHFTQGPHFSNPRAAALDGEPVQLAEQCRDLPAVEDRVTDRIECAEQGKRRLVRPASVISHGSPLPALATTSPCSSRFTLMEITT